MCARAKDFFNRKVGAARAGDLIEHLGAELVPAGDSSFYGACTLPRLRRRRFGKAGGFAFGTLAGFRRGPKRSPSGLALVSPPHPIHFRCAMPWVFPITPLYFTYFVYFAR